MVVLVLRLAPKEFHIGGQNIERNTEYKAQYDFPNQLSGREEALPSVRVVWVPWQRV